MPSKKHSGNPQHLTKGQRLDAMARKKEERAVRAAHRKEKQIMESYLADDANFSSFKAQLGSLGLQLRDIPGDGNCLFRSLGDQLEGHCRNHYHHRLATVQYMLAHRDDFEPFVEDDVNFETHIANLKKLGTYAGNDSLVAFARNHLLNIVIHQLSSPVWQIHGTENKNAQQLHISYHNGDHYSSVRKIGDNTETPTNISIKIDDDNDMTTIKSKAKSDKTKAYSGENSRPYVEGMARAVRDVSDVEQHIIVATGCQDENLVRQILQDNFYDVDSTVAVLLSIMSAGMEDLEDTPYDTTSLSSHQTTDSGIWSDNGTGSRLFGKAESKHSGARPKQIQQLTARQRREMKKYEKKKRAEERHKQNVVGALSTLGANRQDSSSEHSDDGTIVVANGVGVLRL